MREAEMELDWRRHKGAQLTVTDRHIQQIPALLRDIAGATEALIKRLPSEDICFYPLSHDQICGVRREFHADYFNEDFRDEKHFEHSWQKYGH